ncbi:restriction endonuclease subunit S [Campylobacter lanienae]|uniref:restriction endonuclease subunit S n=2 Tax=Campylobacter lanienae TaxID=75658 RepID=UPI001F02802B|nr:restriction endonuclease subunit S [Campylobacter lanienae]
MNKIPKGWEVKKLGEICEINPKTEILLLNESDEVSFIPMASVEAETNIFTESKSKFSKVKKGYTKFRDNDILFAKITPCMENGKICIVNNLKFGIGFGSTEFHVIRPNKNTLSKYIYYFVSQISFRQMAQIYMTGAVGQRRVPSKILENFEIPLPPLSEQKAIADKLDDSFAKIENAITNLINAKENLKLYKQSVLKSAFNGDLLPNTSPTHWEVKKLGEIISKEKYSMKRGPFGSALKKEFFVDNGIRVFEQYNPINSDPHWKRYFITKEKFKELEAFKASAGDLLISCSGTLGKILELPKNTEIGIINQALLKIKLDQKQILNSFFIHYFNSNKFQNLILEKTIGTAIKNIASVSELKRLEIPLPNLTEQNLIVAEIDRRFAIVDKTLNLIDKSIQNAKNLKQSILKKAFSGELRSEI